MKKKILQAVKFMAAIIVGGAIGMIVSLLIINLFTEKSREDILSNIMNTDFVEITGVALISILCSAIALYIHIILHEGGHMIAGLLSGYKFISFRIGSYTLLHTNSQFRIKKFSIAGTGGQCLMLPPHRPIEEINTTLYNLGGVLSNTLFSLIAITLLFITDNTWLSIALAVFAFIGLLLALTNGIPMKLSGISNDGNNVRFLNKNINAKKAFIYQLVANALIQEGTRPKDIPTQYLPDNIDIDYKDPLQTNWMLLFATTLIDKRQYNEAYSLLEKMYSLKDTMIELLQNEIKCELVYTALLTGHNETAQQLYDETLKQYVTQHQGVMTSKKRLLCAIALYMNNNEKEAFDIYNSVKEKQDKYLMQGEANMDIALMQEILSNKKQV